MARVDVFNGETLDRAVDLASKASWIIGRSAESDIQLAHSSISRRHARIFIEDDGYYVEDIGSTHGTKLAGQALLRGCPMRLFDGLRIGVGTSTYELVPVNMMAGIVMEAMRTAQKASEAEVPTVSNALAATSTVEPVSSIPAPSDAHRRGLALLEGGEAGVAETEAAEANEDALRAFLPAGFGKQSAHDGSDQKVQANKARPIDKKSKKGSIKMGVNLGASLGAGAGLAVPAATPTLAALQEKREKEGNPTSAKSSMAPPPPKQIGASLPMRPPTTAGIASNEDDKDEVGPALPPGFSTADEDVAGPPLPPAFAAGAGTDEAESAAVGPSRPTPMSSASHGPALPPGGMVPQPHTGYDPDDLSQQVFPGDGPMPNTSAGEAEGEDDGEDEDDDFAVKRREVRLPVSHQIVLKGHSKMVTCLATDGAGGRIATGSSDHDLRLWDFGGMTSELKSFRHIQEPLGGYQIRSIDFSPFGDRLAVAGSSNQPCIFDREGRKLTTLMRGDMYLRDMRVRQ